MAEVDSKMQQFLDERRINVAALDAKRAADSNERIAVRNKRLRDLAIEKRVRDCVPFLISCRP